MRTNSFNQKWDHEVRGEFESVRRQRGGRGEGRGHGHGRPGFGPGFGPFGGGGGFFGPAWGPVFGPDPRRGGRGRGGPRVRRGDVRAAILDVLASTEDELNGYQIGQQIAERTEDAWRPSPGSIYPTIAALEDEGLVETVAAGSRKVVRLTEAGRAYATENAESLAAVWTAFTEDASAGEDPFKRALVQTMTAMWQVAATGTPEQREQAVEIMAEARRKIYGVLAD